LRVHRSGIRDSGAVVTPFKQDGNYPPMDFATFGPSGLRPPFTGASTKLAKTNLEHLAALGRRQILYIIFQFRKILCFC